MSPFAVFVVCFGLCSAALAAPSPQDSAASEEDNSTPSEPQDYDDTHSQETTSSGDESSTPLDPQDDASSLQDSTPSRKEEPTPSEPPQIQVSPDGQNNVTIESPMSGDDDDAPVKGGRQVFVPPVFISTERLASLRRQAAEKVQQYLDKRDSCEGTKRLIEMGSKFSNDIEIEKLIEQLPSTRDTEDHLKFLQIENIIKVQILRFQAIILSQEIRSSIDISDRAGREVGISFTSEEIKNEMRQVLPDELKFLSDLKRSLQQLNEVDTNLPVVSLRNGPRVEKNWTSEADEINTLFIVQEERYLEECIEQFKMKLDQLEVECERDTALAEEYQERLEAGMAASLELKTLLEIILNTRKGNIEELKREISNYVFIIAGLKDGVLRLKEERAKYQALLDFYEEVKGINVDELWLNSYL